MSVENEYKYTRSADADAYALIDRLESFLVENDVPFKRKSRVAVDSYFDSEDLDLFKADCCLRRKVSSKGKIKLTMKRPISKEDGLMSREEIEEPSDGSISEVLRFGRLHFPDIDIGEEPVLMIECERIAFEYLDGSGLKLSFDTVEYVRPQGPEGYFEIELESMDDCECRDFDSLGIVRFIRDKLGFEPATDSKYRRGMTACIHQD